MGDAEELKQFISVPVTFEEKTVVEENIKKVESGEKEVEDVEGDINADLYDGEESEDEQEIMEDDVTDGEEDECEEESEDENEEDPMSDLSNKANSSDLETDEEEEEKKFVQLRKPLKLWIENEEEKGEEDLDGEEVVKNVNEEETKEKFDEDAEEESKTVVSPSKDGAEKEK